MHTVHTCGVKLVTCNWLLIAHNMVLHQSRFRSFALQKQLGMFCLHVSGIMTRKPSSNISTENSICLEKRRNDNNSFLNVGSDIGIYKWLAVDVLCLHSSAMWLEKTSIDITENSTFVWRMRRQNDELSLKNIDIYKSLLVRYTGKLPTKAPTKCRDNYIQVVWLLLIAYYWRAV